MTIKVYSSIMPGEPAEVYDDHGMTVEAWVAARAKGYQRGECQPISCMINGAIVKPEDWDDTVIGERDVVEFRPVPRGGSFGDILGAVLPFWGGSVAAGQAAIDAITPNIPSASDSMGQQGSRITPADARANTARLGQGIPELFGRYIRYPDYVNQPRRYYKDARTQCLDLMLCITAGECLVEPALIKLGDTPFSQLSTAVRYEIFEPGESVAGWQNHENWYTSSEVGGTSSSAGIRLYRGKSLSSGLSDVQVTYSGTEIRTTSATVYFPGDWGTGDFIAVSRRQSVTVSVDSSDIVTLTGDWGDADVGDQIRLRSTALAEANGVFLIDSRDGNDITLLSDGSPVSGWTEGSYLMFARRENEEFRIDSIIYDTVYPELVDGFSLSRYLSGAEDTAWSGFAGGTGYADVLLSERSESEGWAGPFAACPEGETTDTIEVDFFLPQGQGHIDGDKVVPFKTKRQVEVQWREVGATTWNSQTYTIDNATRDQLGFTYRLSLGSAIRPEVRVRRVQAESNEIADLDRIEWLGLKARLPTVTSYAGVTTMAVTLEGTDQIGSQSNNQINLVATRKLPPVAGGAARATRSIADATAYVARSLGYGDDQINISELERLDGIWQPRGDTFDFVISDGTALDAMKTMLRAGFADVTLDNGIITPVRDEPRTQFEDGYSPENMTAPLRRQFSGKQPDEADGVEVEYTNADTWTTETVMCTLPGDQQIKVDKIKLDGVTDRTRAWRIGMRRRRAQRYRRWTYTFSTELDALNSQYLSYVPLLDDIPGYGKVAILTSISADRITVSEPLEWEPGKSHVVAYRDENGDTVGPFPATQGPDAYTVMVSIPQPWPAVLPSDREQTHIYFGTTERWCFPALITEISPSGPLQVGVTATNYDERVYADDDSAP